MVQRCSGSIVSIQRINEPHSEGETTPSSPSRAERDSLTGADEEGQMNLSGQHVFSQFDEILPVEREMAANEHVEKDAQGLKYAVVNARSTRREELRLTQTSTFSGE